MIQTFQAKFPEGGNGKFAELYFGIPSQDGHVNTEYPDVMRAISTYSDDTIFFASLLCKDLHEYGVALSKKYQKQFGKPVIRIQEVDFTKVRAENLMPAESEYEDYLKSFRKLPESKQAGGKRDGGN